MWLRRKRRYDDARSRRRCQAEPADGFEQRIETFALELTAAA
jgi:hypothetical protein